MLNKPTTQTTPFDMELFKSGAPLVRGAAREIHRHEYNGHIVVWMDSGEIYYPSSMTSHLYQLELSCVINISYKCMDKVGNIVTTDRSPKLSDWALVLEIIQHDDRVVKITTLKNNFGN